jgi:hypothetical protein
VRVPVFAMGIPDKGKICVRLDFKSRLPFGYPMRKDIEEDEPRRHPHARLQIVAETQRVNTGLSGDSVCVMCIVFEPLSTYPGENHLNLT